MTHTNGVQHVQSKAELAGHVEQVEQFEHIVLLIIDGEPVPSKADSIRRHHPLPTGYFQGAEVADCRRAIESCATAFRS